MIAEYKNLEDYGIIGNLETCALVGNDGSIDWLCLPYLESPSLFAAILDVERGGSFSIRPLGAYTSAQAYAGPTNVLQTTFTTPSGAAVLTDFMPVKGGAEGVSLRSLLRKVECARGSVELAVSFAPRPDYARAQYTLTSSATGVTVTWGAECAVLQSPVPLTTADGDATATFRLQAGEALWFVLQYGPSPPVSPADCEALAHSVQEYWRGWVDHTPLPETMRVGQWSDILKRCSLVLKLLTVPENGAIAAAATTSLPEWIGGMRNWDYRFAWIRDASFTTQALFHLGHAHQAAQFRRWVRERVHQAGTAANLRVLYPLRGESDVAEQVLSHLSGYRKSAPVRIGNAAAGQRQLDIYGEALQAFYDTTRYGENLQRRTWPAISALVDHVCDVWDTKDSGIWEVRGGPQHFVYSKLMCWVALDRGIRIAQARRLPAPLDKWRAASDAIRQAILERGFSTKLNSFVQAFDSDTLDAANLLIPQMEFLPADDPRVQGTIDATLAHLTTPDGLVYRYRGDDGLPGGEGTFVLCSFWLVSTLALAGRVEEAEQVFARVCRFLSPLGLMAEEIDPASGRQLGNLPQAFSHVGLVNAIVYLSMAKGQRHAGPRPLGRGPGMQPESHASP